MTQVARGHADAKRPRAARPRLGFLGVGWIGRHRMQAVVEAGAAEAVAIADPNEEALRGAAALVPGAVQCGSLDDLLAEPLDGIIIATPSALHAQQATAALERGLAVFCQKPLARTADEARAIVDAARRADRLLGVDLSYRHTAAYSAVSDLMRAGELGEVYALDMTFHNAYGPDKPWFRDPALSGGGCMIDLGVHMIDLALHSLEWPDVEVTSSEMYAGGKNLRRPGSSHEAQPIEDYASATLRAAGGQSVRIVCSWNLHAAQDAVIELAFHGSRGGAFIRNINGSFYDFAAEQCRGTARTLLTEPPDAWGGRAAVAWAERLAQSGGAFDAEAERFVQVSHILDRIYAR